MLPQARFLLIGHRGAPGHAPENTLAGFAAALALGVDGIELDVHLAAGRLVVIHDRRVEKTTNGHGLVAQLPFETLRRLDAGDGERIPTLDEVLDLVPPEILLNIELKAPGTAAAVARRLAGERRSLLTSSFDHAELARFHALCPAIPCAPLTVRWHTGLRDVVEAVKAPHLNLADRVASAARLQAARGWGCPCFVFTVNDAARAAQLQAWGAGGVFTDYPDRLRSLAPAVEA